MRIVEAYYNQLPPRYVLDRTRTWIHEPRRGMSQYDFVAWVRRQSARIVATAVHTLEQGLTRTTVRLRTTEPVGLELLPERNGEAWNFTASFSDLDLLPWRETEREEYMIRATRERLIAEIEDRIAVGYDAYNPYSPNYLRPTTQTATITSAQTVTIASGTHEGSVWNVPTGGATGGSTPLYAQLQAQIEEMAHRSADRQMQQLFPISSSFSVGALRAEATAPIRDPYTISPEMYNYLSSTGRTGSRKTLPVRAWMEEFLEKKKPPEPPIPQQMDLFD